MELSKKEAALSVESEYAGIGFRFLASLIDGVILGVPLYILTVVFTTVMFMGDPDVMRIVEKNQEIVTEQEILITLFAFLKIFAIIGVFTFLVYFLYYTLMESSKWQATLGKKIMGIRVADTEGGKISFGQAAGRFLAKSFLSPILMIGYILAFFTERKQALHDLLAGTIVLKK
ncbi:RDD family protein [Bacillus sonorensis]|uniref:Membrane protein YxaI n=2 Tax=Bacillus sonorensis TaxID=119858 RepID=M5PEC4_9BACI|nr:MULTISPECIES: RDD family protein [Bacillus]TWK71820.1 hypothetical protein CHCC20335_2456 [Bacillus paralicheniformis]ASB89847.1 Non-specific serine/threonine protein kinase [Bacillus sonorensis]EME74522.1 membrane protein YxaI [Bacillus sonorensis L12]MCF7619099.1 RDD family protein [Bacillus sonorensis]MCY7855463.1 RDD family protein [Bacillus sonorensis]